MTIEIGDGGATIQGSPIIVVKDAISFTRDGKKVASIDAQYDTTGFPQELMNLLIQLIQQQGVNLVLPSAIAEVGEPDRWFPDAPRQEAVVREAEIPPEIEKKSWWRFW